MEEIQKKILELRKELRQDYEKFCKKYFDITLELDTFFASLSQGLDRKEKGGQENAGKI
jgi:hypothetical protein